MGLKKIYRRGFIVLELYDALMEFTQFFNDRLNAGIAADQIPGAGIH